MASSEQSSLLGEPAPIPAGAGLRPPLDALYEKAIQAATRLLAASDKTEKQLRERLEAKGFPPDTVERTAQRLLELGLLDDVAFARRYAQKRRRRSVAGGLIAAELIDKGVDPEVARGAAAEAAVDDAQAANELAVELAAKHARLTPAQQAGRIQRALAGRGFSEEEVEAAVRAVLPPEGWD